MDEAERCSHVAYIYYGKLIADGTPNSLRELPDVQPPGTLRVEITTPEVTRALRFARQIPGIRSATIFGQSIHALIDDHFDLHDLREQLLKKAHRGGGIGRWRLERFVGSLQTSALLEAPVRDIFRGFGAVFIKPAHGAMPERVFL
jgi:hypothetical protein